MAYQVRVPKQPEKQIAGLSRDVQRRVRDRLVALQSDPRPPGATQLVAILPPLWRVRVGDYRIIYDIDDAARVVTVRGVAHRREVYK